MWLIFMFLVSIVRTDDLIECSADSNKTEGGDFMSSFKKFTKDVQTIFKVNITRIDNRRKIIQKALLKFIEEAFGDEPTTGNTTKTKHSKTKSTTPSSLRRVVAARQKPDTQIPELVKAHGYEVESHTVTSTDGYILTVHRILPTTSNASSSTNASSTKTGVVILHHGLLGSSEDWLLLGPKKSLPYLLANANYDVWLTNARGNKYSQSHTSKTPNEDAFWNFSWHEIGQFDLSAVIDYVREHSDNNVHLYFIGHSMGCTALLALLSIYPRYNQVLRAAVLLAPLAFMYEVKGPLRLLAEFYNENNLTSLNFLGVQNFIQLNHFPKKFVQTFCKESELLCSNPLLLLSNGGQDISNVALRKRVLKAVPAGGSAKTLIHYIQQVKSGHFQMFDMGKTKNLKIYGRYSPPNYRLNDVTLPVAIFTSADDLLSTIPDTESLISNLPNPVMHHVVKSYDFSHTDFVWAEDADILVYYLILDVLKQASFIPLKRFT